MQNFEWAVYDKIADMLGIPQQQEACARARVVVTDEISCIDISANENYYVSLLTKDGWRDVQTVREALYYRTRTPKLLSGMVAIRIEDCRYENESRVVFVVPARLIYEAILRTRIAVAAAAAETLEGDGFPPYASDEACQRMVDSGATNADGVHPKWGKAPRRRTKRPPCPHCGKRYEEID